jgi:hypothetical protein
VVDPLQSPSMLKTNRMALLEIANDCEEIDTPTVTYFPLHETIYIIKIFVFSGNIESKSKLVRFSKQRRLEETAVTYEKCFYHRETRKRKIISSTHTVYQERDWVPGESKSGRQITVVPAGTLTSEGLKEKELRMKRRDI